MAKGIIPYASVPGWPNLPDGISVIAETSGISWAHTPTGIEVSDIAAATTLLSTYVGSGTQLAHAKAQKQAALDLAFDSNFDLARFIRGGTATGITATNIGNFLATITNNYRSLRASIAAGATVAAINAININSGWPSNP